MLLRCESVATASGSPSASKLGIPVGTRRSTKPIEPRWRNALTRNRPRPGIPYVKSHSWSAAKVSARGAGDHRGRHPLGVGGLDGVERCLAQPSVDPQARA